MRELAGYTSRFLHRDRNLEIFTSVDIKISLIIAISIALQIAIHLAIIWELARLFGNKRDYMHRGGCVNDRANYLGIFYPIIPSERIKTRAMLDIRHAQFGDQNHPARRSVRYFRLSEQAQKYLISISIAMEISIFLVYECAYYSDLLIYLLFMPLVL